MVEKVNQQRQVQQQHSGMGRFNQSKRRAELELEKSQELSLKLAPTSLET